MIKTPKRNSLSSNIPGFSRVELPESPGSSQKNLTGPHRVAKDIVADVYNSVQQWNGQHLIGSELVKQITHNRSTSLQKYNPELEELTNKLYEIVEEIEKHKDALQLYSQRMGSIITLQPEEPLFITMTVERMAFAIDKIAAAYSKEFDTKKFVLENIAHEDNKDNWMFLACCWTYQCDILASIGLHMESLLLETGHKKIT